MLIVGCVCLLWQVLVNDLKCSPGRVSGSCASLWRPCYDCTNYCYVNRGSIMGAQRERGSCLGGGGGCHERWTVYCVSGRCRMGYDIYVHANLTVTERSRAGKLLDVLGRIVWKNFWRVVFHKHGRCKLRYVVYTGCCIGFSRLSAVGDNIQLSNLLYIFTAPSCYCCLFFFYLCVPFTSVICFVLCLMFYRLDTSCT